MKLAAALPAVVFVLGACKHGEEVGTISGPPLLIDKGDATATPIDAGGRDAEPPLPPVTAEIVDVDAQGFHWDHVACEKRIFAGVSGHVTLLKPATKDAKGQFFAAVDPGDVVVARGKGGSDVKGPGKIVRAIARGAQCEPDSVGDIKARTSLGRPTKPLIWANGAMKAWLMVERADADFTYVGFLEGTAPVAEHQHDGSWEILCAIEANGEFTILGQPQRLAGGTCVSVPPGTKHAWKPDPGSNLRAVQFYSPAGPEQRFRGLAAGDSGAPK